MERISSARAIGLVGRQRYQEYAVTSRNPRRESPIDQDYPRAGRAHRPRRRIGPFRPGQHRAIGIGRIGGGERDGKRRIGFLARRAQQIDCARLRELRGAEARHEVSPSDSPGFFKPAQDRVDRAESAWNLLDPGELARHDAVPRE